MKVETNGKQTSSSKRNVKYVKSADKEIELKILQIVSNLVAEREKLTKAQETLTDKVESFDRQLNVANAVSEKYKTALKNLTQKNVSLEVKNRNLDKKVNDLQNELDHYVQLFKESQDNGIPLSQVKLRVYKGAGAAEERDQNRSKNNDDDILVIDEEAGNQGAYQAKSPSY